MTSEPSLWQLKEHFSAKVAHELDLIGQRMTWFVISESFLVNAWMTTEARQGQFQGDALLRYAIASIGLSVATVAYLGIGAALRVLDRMGALYLEAIEEALGLPPLGHRREDRWTIKFGNIPALALPPLFIALWVGALTLPLGPITAAGMGALSGAACALAAWYCMWKPSSNVPNYEQLCTPLRHAVQRHQGWSVCDACTMELRGGVRMCGDA